jgi:RNA polymerase sigma-70 factor, ECF subfamily
MENTLDPAQEQALIERVQQYQDTDAFRALYRHYFPKVYAYVGYRMATTEDAEDLVAETFLRVVEHIESFQWRGEGSLAAWLFRIARNLVSNYYRNYPNGKEVDLLVLNRLEGAARQPPDAVLQKQRAVVLRELIATLSPRRQEVIMLKFFGGLRNKEIAVLLGLDERTVASHLSRGLRTLHDRYEQQYVMTQEEDPQ